MIQLNFAKPEQIKEVYAIFQKHIDFFPHIRYDYVQRRIASNQLVYEDGVVIAFHRYQRTQKLGDTSIPKGHVMLHQIAAKVQGDGSAGKVLNRFLQAMETPVWLSVRADNSRAIAFYEKNGFIQAGTVHWMNGTLAGKIFVCKQQASN